MKRFSLLLFALAVTALPALGDTLTLKDGTTVEGEVKRNGDSYSVKTAAGVTIVPVDKVARIEMHPLVSNDDAMSRLMSLRRAADNIADIKTIIERFRAFIDQNPGTPAAIAAKTDLDTWQDRKDRGLVKVGDKWITVADRDELRGKSSDIAIGLHDLIKGGRLKEAAAQLDHTLQIDPQNISLNYLHGVLQYQQEVLPASRKSFETVATAAPDHAPTLNNLGVILWRQNAHTAALAYYDRALLAAPGSQEILDNVAEALNALPKEQRETPVVKKLIRHFKEQDDAMQKKMADAGQYRWGGTWVNEKELKRHQDEEAAIKVEMAQMQTDFDGVQGRIAAIDAQVADLSNQMVLIDSQSYAQGPNNQVIRLPLPPIYWNLATQVATLKRERETRTADLERLRKAAHQIQQKLPAPQFSGMQKLIEADGMPLPVPARPAAPVVPPIPAVPVPVAPPATVPATLPAKP